MTLGDLNLSDLTALQFLEFDFCRTRYICHLPLLLAFAVSEPPHSSLRGLRIISQIIPAMAADIWDNVEYILNHAQHFQSLEVFIDSDKGVCPSQWPVILIFFQDHLPTFCKTGKMKIYIRAEEAGGLKDMVYRGKRGYLLHPTT